MVARRKQVSRRCRRVALPADNVIDARGRCVARLAVISAPRHARIGEGPSCGQETGSVGQQLHRDLERSRSAIRKTPCKKSVPPGKDVTILPQHGCHVGRLSVPPQIHHGVQETVGHLGFKLRPRAGSAGASHGELMVRSRMCLSSLPGLVLVSMALISNAAQAAPFSARLDKAGDGLQVELVRDRSGAVAAGVIAGGALGFLAGSALAQPRVYAPPPVYYAPPPPRFVEEEECVVRKTRIYEPGYGWIVRKQRDCY